MAHQFTATNRFGELELIDLDGVFDALAAYCDNLLPDMEACLAFLFRILRDREAAAHPKTRGWLTHLVRKVRDLGPFHLQGLEMVHRLTGDPNLDARLERLAYFPLEQQLMDLRDVLNDEDILKRKRTMLEETLERMPAHVPAASQLLQLDHLDGLVHPAWLDRFVPPKFFQAEWKHRLFLHYASLGDADRALSLWTDVVTLPISEIQLNLAAECFAKRGEIEQALACYRESLKLDPNQTPVRLRMAELESPTAANPALVNENSVVICIQTRNRATKLQQTLSQLARTDIGQAKIRVLLNGSTDQSAEVAEAARTAFPNNDFSVISLPANIGIPAARNWLGSLPEVRASEFVAYVDDDVELPTDWLAHFLTLMERTPEAAAVGAKVVSGSQPHPVQYLYRGFSVARPEIIKLTDPSQPGQFDAGQYDFVRETDTVSGGCHLLRMAHLPDGPQFDVRFTPSHGEDLAHDIKLRLNGNKVLYCGLVKCVRRQSADNAKPQMDTARIGHIQGNDLKFQDWLTPQIDRIRPLLKPAGI